MLAAAGNLFPFAGEEVLGNMAVGRRPGKHKQGGVGSPWQSSESRLGHWKLYHRVSSTGNNLCPGNGASIGHFGQPNPPRGGLSGFSLKRRVARHRRLPETREGANGPWRLVPNVACKQGTTQGITTELRSYRWFAS